MGYDIYQSDEADAWRYALGMTGRRPLFVIGLNPSTATQEASDPTVARVQKVAEQTGFEGFVMLNLYPVRATDWRKLPLSAEAVAYEKNLDTIEQQVKAHAPATIWAAWGEPVLQREYFRTARDALFGRLAGYQPVWCHFGELTKSGHPRHPSRLHYSWQFHTLVAANELPGDPRR